MTERAAVGGEYSEGAPSVVAVGSASRDLAQDDPRGWRLGGGVTYGALALARAGVAVGALIGVDGPAAEAWELDLLRDAGATVRLARLADGPVFANDEGRQGPGRPGGRRQICYGVGGPVAVEALPVGWRGAPGWLFAPVAGELPAAWAEVPSRTACVALGWQGLLRRLTAGAPVQRRAPRPTALLSRADLVGVSVTDLGASFDLATWAGWLGRDRGVARELVVTAGAQGGVQFTVDDGRVRARRRYPAIAARATIDATGAGDVFLALLLAARMAGGEVAAMAAGTARRPRAGASLAVAAAAASLVVEGPGVTAVPTLAQTATRLGCPV